MALWKESKETHQHSLFAILNPPPSGKIGGLRAVETMVKAGMVTVRKGDHEFTSFLGHLDKRRLEPVASNG